MQLDKSKYFFVTLGSCNAIILFLFLLCIDVNILSLKILTGGLLLCTLVSFTSLWFRSKFASFVQNLQFSLFILIVFFCLLEITYFIPQVLPISLRIYLKNDYENSRRQVVEYLDESPFVKFKANTIVRSQGYRGKEEQFVYEWKTDKYGFKNNNDIAKRRQVEAVALGDSFTEGMGVSTDDTWPALLTRYGLTTYNLGVQGYAPSQIEGSFRLYGYSYSPRYIFIGYCSTTFDRERLFIDTNLSKQDRKFAGGISSSIEREIREQTKHVLIACFMFLRNFLSINKYKLSTELKNNDFQSYKSEIMKVEMEKVDQSMLEASPEWRKTLQAFSNIKKLGDRLGAKTIIIILPGRGEIYYEKATGKKLSEQSLVRVESVALKKYCQKHDIGFIDLKYRLLDYMGSLANTAPPGNYPYLEIDGHLSPRGHQLVAEEIIDYLKISYKLN